MIQKLPVVILYGGKSSEHEVSLRSTASILQHAPWATADICLIGIQKDGQWVLQNAELIEAVRGGADLSIEPGPQVLAAPGNGLLYYTNGVYTPLEAGVVFPVLHGTFGEDGTIQGLLEICNLPYVGSGVLGSSLGMDKEKIKQVWHHNNLPIVDYALIRLTNWQRHQANEHYELLRQRFGSVMFIKPCNCGSSVGISRVDDASSFARGVEQAFVYDSKVLIEPAINAREIEVAIVGNASPRAFVPGEVVPVEHAFYDYEAKYLDPKGATIQIPANLSAQQIEIVRELAIQAYLACEGRGFARVDFFLDKNNGQFVLNEINTLPGFTTISMFPMMCAAGGLEYPELLHELCTLALTEHQHKEALRFTRY
jgi:D-alanine-D-alanine ligase